MMGGNGSLRHVSLEPAAEDEEGVTVVKGIRVSVLKINLWKSTLFALLNNFNYIIYVVVFIFACLTTRLL